MENDLIYLDTYVLQQDMRIRMPKSILTNLPIKKGETQFEVYLDKKNNELRLRIATTEEVAEK